MKKGQMLEILGFLTMVVVIVMSLLLLKFATTSQKIGVMGLAQESHENEFFNAGANTLIVITEPATNKTFVELIGLAGFLERGVLEFGPTDNPITVEVFDELTERLDMIYGEGQWHLEIPHVPRYQVYTILLLDVSLSMEDEIMNIKKNIVRVMRHVEESTDRRVAFKLYFLPTGGQYRDQFSEIEENNPDFKTYLVPKSCSTRSNKNEAWATCMKSLIDDKVDEWGNVSAKVGIILSDEPPNGCEGCGCKHHNDIATEACCPDVASCENNDDPGCATKEDDIQALIDRANADDAMMNIFTLKANPCNLPDKFKSQCSFASKIPYTCSGEQKLIEFMDMLSDGTGAKRYTVDDAKDVSKVIEEIVLSQPIPEESFSLGSPPPGNTIIHSYTITAPTPIPGVYVNAILKQWN